jgi:Uma2 family endonuclease
MLAESPAWRGIAAAKRGATMVVVTEAEPDQRVVMHDVSWELYESLIETRGESARPRLSYLDGVLELMSPSQPHEIIKAKLGSLLSFYCVEMGIEIQEVGSWTIRQRRKKGGLEPDESFIFGRESAQAKQRPDLAIEVVWTSGGIRKLDIYQRLGVPEVWFWKKEVITIYGLDDDRYVKRERSAFVPDIDLALICRLVHCVTTNDAYAELRAALRK